MSGSMNPNYRGGKSKCIGCKKELSYRCLKIDKKCRKCWLDSCKKKPLNYPSCINCYGRTGDYKSILCKNCYRGALRPAWKGGISSVYSLIRGLPENRQWQKQCMYRDRWICTECSSDKNLEVHHIKSFAMIIKENNIKTIDEAKSCKELWDMNNGKTLCRECHKLTDNYSKKLNGF